MQEDPDEDGGSELLNLDASSLPLEAFSAFPEIAFPPPSEVETLPYLRRQTPLTAMQDNADSAQQPPSLILER